jgi:Glutamine amidotransferase
MNESPGCFQRKAGSRLWARGDRQEVFFQKLSPQPLASRHREAVMIAIIDYGMGNLRSVHKAFAAVGHDAIVTRDSHVLNKPAILSFLESGLSLTA